MKRNTLNFIVDLLSALVLMGLIVTGVVIHFVLPHGSGGGGGGRGMALWGLGRHDWGDVHFWLAVAAVGLLLIHVALHWQWVCVTTLRALHIRESQTGYPGRFGRNLAGASTVVLLVVSLLAFTWIARASVRSAGGGGGGEHGPRGGSMAEAPRPTHPESEGGGPMIRGSMTLAEVSSATGVPLDQVRSRLKLPANTPPDERMGRLRQQYGFTMDQVREALGAVPSHAPATQPATSKIAP